MRSATAAFSWAAFRAVTCACRAATSLPWFASFPRFHARGASLRKLAPVQPIAVNGRNVGSTYLNSGDRVTIGVVEVVVSLTAGADVDAFSDEPSPELATRQAELQAESEQLEKDRLIWFRRRDEIETLCRRQTEAAEAANQKLQERENELLALRNELEREQAQALREED